ncbi:aminodeoxychorismate lyase [Halomonas denitrificans]|nr:aminodeoxychorismate lyase [Halomonas denitrificans]
MTRWLDGRPTASVPGDDRGLTLGDGHFTTMLVQQGGVVLWHRHRTRLAEANDRLGFAQPDWHQLEAEIQQASQGIELGCLRLTLTRGSAGRGYQGQWPAVPRRLLALSPFPSHYRQSQQQGIDAEVAELTLASGGPLIGLKTLGRLEQVLIKQEAASRNVDELLVCDGQGQLVEASAGNLFLVFDDGTVVTPSLAECGIAGVMRAEVLALLGQAGQKVVERPVRVEELTDVAEAFVTNALMGVMPLRQIGEKRLNRQLADLLLESHQLWR